MPTCKRCHTSGPSHGWPRSPRNGRLKPYCSVCDAIHQEKWAAVAQAHERGYAGVGNTPEYKRLQRESEAQKQGRTLPAYVPQAEQNRVARMNRAERQADQIRAKWAAEWLRPFRDEKTLYRSDAEFREQSKAEVRDYYSRHRMQESARVQEYKARNIHRVERWNETRNRRVALASDGTATKAEIDDLKRHATHCAYCVGRLIRKQTDHMTPLALGGEHSLRNIVIVCPDCNGRKARLSYAEWIERVEPEHRARVAALWHERYGREAAA